MKCLHYTIQSSLQTIKSFDLCLENVAIVNFNKADRLKNGINQDADEITKTCLEGGS